MKTRVHINLNVSDLDQSIAFYRKLLGAAPTKKQADYANWRLDNPALHLALVHIPKASVADKHARHFGIELFDDRELAGWKQRVEQAGLSIRTEQEVTCCYAVADKFWAADPDGNEWEFWVRHEDVPAEALAKAGANAMHGAENAPTEEGACCGASAQENAKAKAAGSCCAAGATTAKQEQPAKSGCC
ncbi:catechol 2,3-dioxygenase [Planctomycetaceae bacterium]|nr:catechol 2,3-dioxygenase [Planctomycetaceae bacterium]